MANSPLFGTPGCAPGASPSPALTPPDFKTPVPLMTLLERATGEVRTLSRQLQGTAVSLVEKMEEVAGDTLIGKQIDAECLDICHVHFLA